MSAAVAATRKEVTDPRQAPPAGRQAVRQAVRPSEQLTSRLTDRLPDGQSDSVGKHENIYFLFLVWDLTEQA